MSMNDSSLNFCEEKKSRNQKENFLFDLNTDILEIINLFLDSISLLKFQSVNHSIRKFSNNDSKIWENRWIWKNEKLENSLPNNLMAKNIDKKSKDNFIYFRNIDVIFMKLIIEVTFGIIPFSALTELLLFDSFYEVPEFEMLNDFYDIKKINNDLIKKNDFCNNINNDDNNNNNKNHNNDNDNNNNNNDENNNCKDNNHPHKYDEISVKKSEKFENYEELINY